MSNKLVVKMAFPGKGGKKIPIELPITQIYQVISDLLKVSASIPQSPSLVTDIPGDTNPVLATGFQISPIDGDQHLARVSIVVGATHLHVAVPLAALMEQFAGLKLRAGRR